MARNIHSVKQEHCSRERKSFSQIKQVLPIPFLVDIQKASYDEFISNGVREVFEDFSPITDFSGHYELRFVEHSLDSKPKYSEKECHIRDASYEKPLKVKVRLTYKDTGEVVEQEVFMVNLPIMTDNGSFIINGAERVVVSQLVRSPSVYHDVSKDKNGRDIYNTTVIPNRGAWLEFEQDMNDVLSVKVDRTRKVPATVLLRALGFGTDSSLLELFENNEIIKATIEKDTTKSEHDALIELYKRLKPGEVPAEDSIKTQIYNTFYDVKRYDLAKVGRYKFNKKLRLAARLEGRVITENLADENGEIIAKSGERITEELAKRIQNAGINEVHVATEAGVKYKVMGNNTVDLKAVTGISHKEVGLLEYVYYPTLKKILDKGLEGEALKAELAANADELCHKHIVLDDIVSTINYNIGLRYGIGNVDNIDHLGNRRVRSVGELLQNQFRIGISRLERVIKERMSTQEQSEVTPQTLINVRPVASAIREFFGSSQLSQFMDQSNPIAELTHKRKLSALGPGGLNRDRATFDVRDVHYSHYGRMCPIETPEGQNIGLISSLSAFARVNEYGFIETPYRKVDKATGVVTDMVNYLTADEEDKYYVAQANEPLDEEGHFLNDRVTCRHLDEIVELPKEIIDYMDVSPKQLVSIATALIPFLENDDTNRALMGSNMQRQAVPLLKPEAPIVATGVEHRIAYDSGVMILAKNEGIVEAVSADYVRVRTADGCDEYSLKKFERSNQGTCLNQRPIVSVNQFVGKGDVIADGPATDGGELALGRNILIGFMTWEGYNYEDAILISEKLVREDVFTSIHIEKYEVEARDTKLGVEEITRDIPNVGDDALKYLDSDGIIMVGAEVHSQDILVGKVSPKGEADLAPEERLLRAIFGEKAREVKDTSLRVPHGEGGVVVDVKVFTRENSDELDAGVSKLVQVSIAQKRKISIGDKMAGRHGNKGVISRVLPESDMPFLADGTPLQIVLNPLGVPSRMNIGQVLEVHLGLVAKALGWYVETPVFDGANEDDIENLLRDNGFVNPDGKVDGKVQLYDGRTGEPFENRVTVGQMYMLKLCHLVDDKIHARSTGPYSLVTQQPLGGKAQFGGQRFGEMEVWALEAYGAANILQEILTVKSDDVNGRTKTYESIVKGSNISEPGIPESFRVLIKEMQALGLDVKVLNENKEELSVKDIMDDDVDASESREERRRGAEEDVDLFDDLQGAYDTSVYDLEDDDDEFDESGNFDLLSDDDEFETAKGMKKLRQKGGKKKDVSEDGADEDSEDEAEDESEDELDDGFGGLLDEELEEDLGLDEDDSADEDDEDKF